MSEIFARFQALSEPLLPASGVVLAGVSGGADSLALLHLLARMLPDARRRLVAVHVHHGLRGPDADRDQRWVEGQCRAVGVRCEVYRRKVEHEASRRKFSLEEAGRLARQECFLDAARRFDARAVAVAHHQDDQAETLFLNLLRGAGGRGLSGLRPSRPFPHPQAPPGLRLIRPLLTFSKSELEEYLRLSGVRWRRDLSNASLVFARNRIRRQVLPYLERTIQPRVRELLARSAEALARDNDWLETQVKRRLRMFPKPESGRALRLERRGLRRVPVALRWRLLAEIWDRLEIPGKTADHLAALIRAAEEPIAEFELPGRWRVRSQGEALEFLPPAKEAPKRMPRHLPVYGVESVTVTVPREVKKIHQAADYLLVDEEKLVNSVTLSHRKAGDSMRPLGLGGQRKTIKKIMSEMKIPAAQRDSWPILKMGREIIWVYRGPVSETVKISPNSRKALRIRLVSKKRS